MPSLSRNHQMSGRLNGGIVRLLSIVALTSFQVPLATDAQNTNPVAPALQSRPASITIGGGDLIDVEVFNTPELSGRIRVNEDGLVKLAGATDVKVSGLNAAEAGAAIEENLRDSQIMLNPHVTVLVTEYSTQGTTVLGEVNKPGTYLLLGPHSLSQALSAAGGTTQQVGSTIEITHQNNSLPPETVLVDTPNHSERQQLKQVHPGDVVVVSRAAAFYVVGDVAHPGQFYIENGRQLTVLNAIAIAQGLNPTARLNKASIVRKTATGAQTIPVNLKHIADNNGDNPVLRSEDVLVVPRSGGKAFINLALPGITGAVAGSVAAALLLR